MGHGASSAEADLALIEQCGSLQVTHVCLFFSQMHHKPAAWSVFSLASLSGSGLEPPLQFAKEKCTCWSIPGIFRNSLICVPTLLQCNLYHSAVRNTESFCEPSFVHTQVTFAYIIMPGCKPISIRTTTINCNRARKQHDSQFFSPLGECFEKLNLLCQARGHQWDFMRLSELRWEMCQRCHICFSAADGEGWPAWPRPINGQTIINVHEAALLVISSTYSWLSSIDTWSIRQLDETVKQENKR